ncbi:MAG: tRNA lysidine(34) synthetase TilS [Bacteroidales bacterium]|nr:tRNA lysidine(34) synthetase TilS [Bacteroidales bacterium]
MSVKPHAQQHPLERHIANTLRQHQLLAPYQRVLVGVSGGADSVALLLALHALGHSPVAVHVNFNLRGAESVRDENYVRRLCTRHHIALEVFGHDTTTEAKALGESIEMAARRIRYTRFKQVSQRLNINRIAVAHHKADNAETLLLNLVRGSGLRGLCGMRYRHKNIIRPCLNIDKALLIDYLTCRNECFVTDSSNMAADVKRNKLRLEILPLLQALNPSIIDTLHDTAQRLHESLLLYEHGLATLTQDIVTHYAPSDILTHPRLTLDRTALTQNSAATTLLHEILSPYGFTSEQITTILSQAHQQAGAVFYSAQWELHRERNQWALYPSAAVPISQILHEGDNIIIGLGTLRIERLSRQLIDNLRTPSHIALVDTAKLRGKLTLRPPHTGERFCPLGMQHRQLVSDHLTNNHISLRQKRLQTAVCDEQGIVWLTGVRLADNYKITTSTHELLRLTWLVENPKTL